MGGRFGRPLFVAVDVAGHRGEETADHEREQDLALRVVLGRERGAQPFVHAGGEAVEEDGHEVVGGERVRPAAQQVEVVHEAPNEAGGVGEERLQVIHAVHDVLCRLPRVGRGEVVHVAVVQVERGLVDVGRLRQRRHRYLVERAGGQLLLERRHQVALGALPAQVVLRHSSILFSTVRADASHIRRIRGICRLRAPLRLPRLPL